MTPGGRVVGLDLLPALPPKGVSTLQGNFLEPSVQAMLRAFLADPGRGAPHAPAITQSYIDLERAESEGPHPVTRDKCVDVVLSDMWEPWELEAGSFFKNSLAKPQKLLMTLNQPGRLMNTSGISFKDQTMSMVRDPRPPRPLEC